MITRKEPDKNSTKTKIITKNRQAKRFVEVGQVYAKYTVIEKLPSKVSSDGSKYSVWACRCACGRVKPVRGKSLLNKNTTGCGCQKRRGVGDETARNAVYAGYRSNALRRRQAFELSKEYFSKIIKENCFYCGKPPSNRYLPHNKRCRGDPCIYNGIDRIDNNIGYTESNIVPCCKFCNVSKGRLTKDEFLENVKQIYKHMGLGKHDGTA